MHRRDIMGSLDELVQQARHERGPQEGLAVVGFVLAELFGPDGELKQQLLVPNLITDAGDQYYAQQGITGVSPANPSAPNRVSGMKLGTGTTAVAKNGAGAAIVTYAGTGITASKALDATFPTAATKGAGAGWRITYKTTWNAGEVTINALAEVVLSTETALADDAGTAANTVSRALLSPVVNKGANDTLALTWFHDFLGA